MSPSTDPLHAGEVNAVAKRCLPSGVAIRRSGVAIGVGGVIRLVGLVHERVGRHERAPAVASAERPGLDAGAVNGCTVVAPGEGSVNGPRKGRGSQRDGGLRAEKTVCVGTDEP